MRKVTIHDTNILIDLKDLSLFEQFFSLNFEFHTTDLAFNEIKGLKKQEISILKSNLKIKSFEADEFQKIVEKEKEYTGLSIEDLSILDLSISLNGILCTGDKRLKNEAKRKNLETHGILWIIKQMVVEKKITSNMAIQKLEKLEKTNPRISKKEIEILIEKLQNHWKF